MSNPNDTDSKKYSFHHIDTACTPKDALGLTVLRGEYSSGPYRYIVDHAPQKFHRLINSRRTEPNAENQKSATRRDRKYNLDNFLVQTVFFFIVGQ